MTCPGTNLPAAFALKAAEARLNAADDFRKCLRVVCIMPRIPFPRCFQKRGWNLPQTIVVLGDPTIPRNYKSEYSNRQSSTRLNGQLLRVIKIYTSLVIEFV